MKVVYLVPGSGNSFYCENCVRDGGVFRALNGRKNIEAVMVPIYLPPPGEAHTGMVRGPLFFGAVNLYVKHKFPRLSAVPGIKGLLNSPALLSFAAKRAGSVRSSGLEDMTLSMLRGDTPYFREEILRLAGWLSREIRPDIIHLSNALLSGFIPLLKESLSVPVVCSLQDEDTWIAEMGAEYQDTAWDLLRENSRSIDLFLPVSDWYKGQMRRRLGIPEQALRVVPLGIDPQPFAGDRPIITGREVRPVIGFLSRLCPRFGLDTLAEAYLLLRQTAAGKEAVLRITGGYTSDDLPFLNGLLKRIRREGGRVEVMEHFGLAERAGFLSSLSLFSVPASKPEAFGLFQLEAMASGVPLVMPDHGGYVY